jgi:YVTN family beta-propeller protein
VTSGRAFVANSADGTLTVIDTETDAVAETVGLDCTGPNEVFVDGEGEVAVVCEGGGDANGEVVFVEPGTLQILARVSLPAVVGSDNFTQSAYYSALAEELYAISGSAFGTGSGDVFRVDTDGNVLDATLPVPDDPALAGLTAVGYDAINEALYVARLPVGDDGSASFTARGTAVILDRDGNQMGSFRTGIAPAHIDFLRDTR